MLESEINRRVAERVNQLLPVHQLTGGKADDESDFLASFKQAGMPSKEEVEKANQEINEKIMEIEDRLENLNSVVNREIEDFQGTGEDLEKKLSRIGKEQDELIVKGRDACEASRKFAAENTELLSDIACVRGVTQYTVWLRVVEQVNMDLTASLETKDKLDVVNNYQKLRQLNQILSSSKCANLKRYVERVRDHWYTIIHDLYVDILSAVLGRMGWPFVDTTDGGSAKSLQDLTAPGLVAGDVTTLRDAIWVLFSIQQRPEDKSTLEVEKSGDQSTGTESLKSTPEKRSNNTSVADIVADTSISLPMKVLAKPLRKRFKYHFLGSKATNNPAKPEWFITQLTTWALAHRNFLCEYVQSVYDDLGIVLPAKMEFGQALVSMAVEKLSVDIPIVVQDDVLFAHTIDETIGFARDLSKHLQYSASQPSVLEPLTQPNIFSRWLNMERKFAFEKVDSLFMEEGTLVWESDLGDCLTPRAAESFLALLLSVTERYKFLSLSHHRLQFLNLQIDLIEDFRIRLVQLVRTEKENPLSSHLCPIVNTVDHLIIVLSNWAETPFFIQLAYQKDVEERLRLESDSLEDSRLADSPDILNNTVFQEKIEELQYFRDELVHELVTWIFYQTTAKTIKYRAETKWFSMTVAPEAVSHEVCDMLQTLAFSLETCRRRLVSTCFRSVWMQLAERLDNYIITNVVLVNKFSLAGAEQLDLDMESGMFPIFGEFTSCPPAHFPELVDVLRLLTLPLANLVLCREGLLSADEDGGLNILSDVGVNNISPEQAVKIMNQRIDADVM